MYGMHARAVVSTGSHHDQNIRLAGVPDTVAPTTALANCGTLLHHASLDTAASPQSGRECGRSSQSCVIKHTGFLNPECTAVGPQRIDDKFTVRIQALKLSDMFVRTLLQRRFCDTVSSRLLHLWLRR